MRPFSDHEVDELLNATEGNHFEFKEAKNRYDFEEAAKYCCALANCGGGKLVLGVSDKRPRKIVGSNAFDQPERARNGLMDKLRVCVGFQLYEYEGKRVLVFEVASRPVGLPIQVDGIAWWRDGDSLVPMSESVRRQIYMELEYDFSSEICPEATINDLDGAAIEKFRKKWSDHTRNKRITSLSNSQLLCDCGAITDKGVTYAALILFGKRTTLKKQLPHAEVVFEYRSKEVAGPAAQREEFQEGFFSYDDRIWELVNLRNDEQHYRDGFYKHPILTFNEDVVREAVLNAVSHRDYQLGGSIFVRQYQSRLVVESPGGFPRGITVENILNRQNARNRLIADIFRLCGLVERSGQGMNLIYEMAIKEAKPLPNFSGSDAFFVMLTIGGKVIDSKMLSFIKKSDAKLLDAMTTDDYLLLSALFLEEDLRSVDPARFKHLIELEIVKHSAYGVEPANSGIIFAVGNQSATNADKMPIKNADRNQHILDYIASHGNVTTAQLAQYLELSQRTIRNILKELIAHGLVEKLDNYRRASYATPPPKTTP